MDSLESSERVCAEMFPLGFGGGSTWHPYLTLSHGICWVKWPEWQESLFSSLNVLQGPLLLWAPLRNGILSKGLELCFQTWLMLSPKSKRPMKGHAFWWRKRPLGPRRKYCKLVSSWSSNISPFLCVHSLILLAAFSSSAKEALASLPHFTGKKFKQCNSAWH